MRRYAWLKWALVTLLFLALLMGQSWATYLVFTSRYPGGNDFYARWANGCALVWNGENPYSEAVTRQAQIGMYGRRAEIGEDLAAFSYPLYALFFFWPLCFIHSYPMVQAVWMTLMLYALLAGIVLTARVARWEPPGWLWGVTLVWGVLNYPHARALVLGQMATVVFLALTVALLMLERKLDGLAGAVLAVTTIKPQMSFLLLPWVLWWAAWQRRWRVWKGFGLAMGLLTGVSFLLVPTWIGDFLEGVRRYDLVAATDYHSLTWIVTRHILRLGPVVEGLGLAAFALYALLAIWQGRQAGWAGFLWTTGLVLILTHFIAPRTATTHYTTLLLPLFSWFVMMRDRMGASARLVIVGVEVLLFLGQWVIFLTTLQGNYETASVYLPFPVLLLVMQLLLRRYHLLEA